MGSIKNLLLLPICVLLGLSLCGCTLLINKFRVETEDLNGEEDCSLAVLTEEDICAEENICYCVAFGLSPSGSGSYADGEYLHDADSVHAVASTPLSGVSLLQITYATEDTVTFTVDCKRTKGNVRIVLLDENLDIIHDFSITESSTHTVEHAKGKEFEIRVAGESAEFTVDVSREFSSQ